LKRATMEITMKRSSLGRWYTHITYHAYIYSIHAHIHDFKLICACRNPRYLHVYAHMHTCIHAYAEYVCICFWGPCVRAYLIHADMFMCIVSYVPHVHRLLHALCFVSERMNMLTPSFLIKSSRFSCQSTAPEAVQALSHACLCANVRMYVAYTRARAHTHTHTHTHSLSLSLIGNVHALHHGHICAGCQDTHLRPQRSANASAGVLLQGTKPQLVAELCTWVDFTCGEMILRLWSLYVCPSCDTLCMTACCQSQSR
jgi:hypothetical protein